jgi:hypothetical protein
MVGIFYFLYSRTKTAGDFLSTNLLTWTSLSSFSIGGAKVTGTGDIKSESRNLAAYSVIKSNGAIDIKWSPGPTSSAVVEAQENLLPHIKTEVVDGTLKIYSDCSYNSNKPITVTLVGPSLEEITLSGSGDFDGTSIDGENLELNLAGSGRINFEGKVHNLNATLTGAGNLTATMPEGKNIEATIAGSAKLHLHGAADHFKVSITGSGDADAADLKTLSTQVIITGSGDASVNASDTLSASIFGSGSITYQGTPAHLTKNIVGSGSLQSR